MTCGASRKPKPDELATARADLRALQHRLAVIERQQAFLLRAIDEKRNEIDRLEHPGIWEALARVLREGGATDA